jgi:hypothetical protein
MNYILNEDGNPVHVDDCMEWARWYEKADRKVAKDTLPSGLLVSTVFLGIDHGFSDNPDVPPILFETMVFMPGSYDELECERYATKAEALKGHEAMVKRWLKKGVPDVPVLPETLDEYCDN